MIYIKIITLFLAIILDLLTVHFRAAVLPAVPWALLFFLAGVIAVNVMVFRAARAKRNRQWGEL